MDCHNQNKALLDRLKRIEGQVRGLQKMIENERYCIDVLTQVASVMSALRAVGDQVMRRHLNTCVADAMSNDDPGEKQAKIDEVMTILAKFRR